MSSTSLTPTVHLLPAPFFFVRVLAVEAQATPESVAQQVELAIEAWAPFPLPQLFFGYAWSPGSPRAIVYVAYRRRFTAEQQAGWPGADWVAPDFAPWLRWPAERADSLVLHSAEGLSVLHWADGPGLPTHVLTRPLPPDATPEQRAALQGECLKGLPGSVRVQEFAASAEIEGDPAASSLSFRHQTVELGTAPRAEFEAMDVRDRGDLAAHRRARQRDHWLWRLTLGAAWVIVLGLVVQAVLWGAFRWEHSREARLVRKAPEVEAINRANELATRIEELATKRLRPFEMIDLVKEKRPPNLVYKSLTTQGLLTLEINGTTPVAADLPVYRAALAANPLIEKAEFTDQAARDGVTSFRLIVTFKPEALPNSEPTP